jgi:hypothetical protein
MRKVEAQLSENRLLHYHKYWRDARQIGRACVPVLGRMPRRGIEINLRVRNDAFAFLIDLPEICSPRNGTSGFAKAGRP